MADQEHRDRILAWLQQLARERPLTEFQQAFPETVTGAPRIIVAPPTLRDVENLVKDVIFQMQRGGREIVAPPTLRDDESFFFGSPEEGVRAQAFPETVTGAPRILTATQEAAVIDHVLTTWLEPIPFPDEDFLRRANTAMETVRGRASNNPSYPTSSRRFAAYLAEVGESGLVTPGFWDDVRSSEPTRRAQDYLEYLDESFFFGSPEEGVRAIDDSVSTVAGPGDFRQRIGSALESEGGRRQSGTSFTDPNANFLVLRPDELALQEAGLAGRVASAQAQEARLLEDNLNPAIDAAFRNAGVPTSEAQLEQWARDRGVTVTDLPALKAEWKALRADMLERAAGAKDVLRGQVSESQMADALSKIFSSGASSFPDRAQQSQQRAQFAEQEAEQRQTQEEEQERLEKFRTDFSFAEKELDNRLQGRDITDDDREALARTLQEAARNAGTLAEVETLLDFIVTQGATGLERRAAEAEVSGEKGARDFVEDIKFRHGIEMTDEDTDSLVRALANDPGSRSILEDQLVQNREFFEGRFRETERQRFEQGTPIQQQVRAALQAKGLLSPESGPGVQDFLESTIADIADDALNIQAGGGQVGAFIQQQLAGLFPGDATQTLQDLTRRFGDQGFLPEQLIGRPEPGALPAELEALAISAPPFLLEAGGESLGFQSQLLQGLPDFLKRFEEANRPASRLDEDVLQAGFQNLTNLGEQGVQEARVQKREEVRRREGLKGSSLLPGEFPSLTPLDPTKQKLGGLSATELLALARRRATKPKFTFQDFFTKTLLPEQQSIFVGTPTFAREEKQRVAFGESETVRLEREEETARRRAGRARGRTIVTARR